MYVGIKFAVRHEKPAHKKHGCLVPGTTERNEGEQSRHEKRSSNDGKTKTHMQRHCLKTKFSLLLCNLQHIHKPQSLRETNNTTAGLNFDIIITHCGNSVSLLQWMQTTTKCSTKRFRQSM